MRHRQQRPRRQPALELALDFVCQRLDANGRHFFIRQLVQRFLEVRHCEHATKREDCVRVRCLDLLSVYLPREHATTSVLGVAETRLSRNIDWFSAYATDVGARSCEKSGEGMSMFAK